jgi:mono/diheme cytochrome c family protein
VIVTPGGRRIARGSAESAMKNRVSLIVLCVWLAAIGYRALQAAPQIPPAAASTTSQQAVVLKQYCITCHNERLKTGNLALDSIDLANLSANAETWEKVVRKLRTGSMPPVGARRPDDATYHSLIGWLEGELDRGEALQPNPGRPLIHRLNRTEYANAIRDLLALDLGDVTSLLPADDSSYGFDNIADVLGVSPFLQERYLAAADRISALAVGDTDTTAGSDTFRLRQDLSQDTHIEGLPLGTVGGLRVNYTFPLDGEYSFDVKLFRNNQGATRGLDYEHQLEIAIDGERVHLANFGGNAELEKYYENVIPTSDAVDARFKVRVSVKAGPRIVTVAFLEAPPVQDTKRLEPFLRSSFGPQDHTGYPHIETFTIAGPFNSTGRGDTPSRRRLFVCRPATKAAEEPCARQLIETVARRAYRRPIPAAELEQLLAFYRTSEAQASFDRRIQLVLRRILASPKFVFRVEPDPPGTAIGATYRISDLELASRLSFFLWSTIPDDELLTVASQGRLKNQAVLEAQVRRMLADPKADALAKNFAGQWLQLRNLQNVIPDPVEFPNFDDNLRAAFARETELLFGSIMREDRSVVDLLTADYTFVNERLARHYKIPNVYGSHYRRVAIKDETRRGLLGHGSILTVTSHAAKTSPVLRGKWILENLYGTPPPPPPPEVPALEEEGESGPLTMRQQMEKHRTNPPCAGCHKLMDPIGFALENFDAIGAWRSRDAGKVIDASGQLSDGTQVDGVVTLRQAIVKRTDVFVRTTTEKLLTYALGRGLTYHDMPVVRAIVGQSARQNYRFSTLVLGIINSSPFQMRIKPAPEPESARATAQ